MGAHHVPWRGCHCSQVPTWSQRLRIVLHALDQRSLHSAALLAAVWPTAAAAEELWQQLLTLTATRPSQPLGIYRSVARSGTAAQH